MFNWYSWLAIGYMVGQISIDLNHDYYILAGERAKLPAVASFYEIIEKQPQPWSMITPAAIILFGLMLLGEVVKHKRLTDIASLVMVFIGAAVFGVVVTIRRELLQSKTDDERFSYLQTLSYLHILAMVLTCGVGVLNFLSQPQIVSKRYSQTIDR